MNKKEFIDKIKQINFNNSNTNYTNSFEKVFESFTSLTHISLTQNIIIFITDEHQNDNNSFSITELISSIQLLEIKYNITPIIISYVIGDNSTYVNIINQLCCKYSGFTETIIDSSEIKEKVEKLFSFLANDLNITQVVWTEPYQDSDGLGMLTTAAIPFYDRALVKLIGVVGVDVLLLIKCSLVSFPLHSSTSSSSSLLLLFMLALALALTSAFAFVLFPFFFLFLCFFALTSNPTMSFLC